MYMKEIEAISMKSWEFLIQFHDFLSSLGVNSLEPSHEIEGDLASVRWVASGLTCCNTVGSPLRPCCLDRSIQCDEVRHPHNFAPNKGCSKAA